MNRPDSLTDTLGQRLDRSRHRSYAIRLFCGGIIGGFFVGAVLGTALELGANLAFDSSLLGMNGIFAVGAALAIFGGTWGVVLGLTDKKPRP